MDFNDTKEQAEFRKICRDWLEANASLKSEKLKKSDSSNSDYLQAAKDWQKKKFDAAGPCYIGQKNMVE